ncbi:MAG: GUN4 domain-containing protein [Prochloraceae cyanobacterium]
MNSQKNRAEVKTKNLELKNIEATLNDKERDRELKIECLKKVLNYGNDGIKLLFKILTTERGELQYLAYDLLWEKANNKGKKRLLQYFPWPSEVGADYNQLRNLLIAKKWREADLETRRLMLSITGADRRKDRLLTQKDIETFPCTDLLSIDRLWVRYSGGKFGFSVVQNLYTSVGEDYLKLAGKVGWRLRETWLKYEDLRFTNKARQGHLPVAWLVPISFSDYWIARFARVGWNLLFDRLNSCDRVVK